MSNSTKSAYAVWELKVPEETSLERIKKAMDDNPWSTMSGHLHKGADKIDIFTTTEIEEMPKTAWTYFTGKVVKHGSKDVQVFEHKNEDKPANIKTEKVEIHNNTDPELIKSQPVFVLAKARAALGEQPTFLLIHKDEQGENNNFKEYFESIRKKTGNKHHYELTRLELPSTILLSILARFETLSSITVKLRKQEFMTFDKLVSSTASRQKFDLIQKGTFEQSIFLKEWHETASNAEPKNGQILSANLKKVGADYEEWRDSEEYSSKHESLIKYINSLSFLSKKLRRIEEAAIAVIATGKGFCEIRGSKNKNRKEELHIRLYKHVTILVSTNKKTPIAIARELIVEASELLRLNSTKKHNPPPSGNKLAA